MGKRISQTIICILMLVAFAGCTSSADNGLQEASSSPIVVSPKTATATAPVGLQIAPTAQVAPSYETIQEQMAHLVDQERSRSRDGTIHPDSFSQSDAFVNYQQSIRGKQIIGWKGLVAWIQEVGSTQTVFIDMKGPGPYNDVFLN